MAGNALQERKMSMIKLLRWFRWIEFLARYKLGLAKEGKDFQTEGFCVYCDKYESCMEELDSLGYPHPDYTCSQFSM